jgi:hypothetical protein
MFGSSIDHRYLDTAIDYLQHTTDPGILLIDGFGGASESPGAEVTRALGAWRYAVDTKGLYPGRVALRWTRFTMRPQGALRITVIRPGVRWPTFR